MTLKDQRRFVVEIAENGEGRKPAASYGSKTGMNMLSTILLRILPHMKNPFLLIARPRGTIHKTTCI